MCDARDDYIDTNEVVIGHYLCRDADGYTEKINLCQECATDLTLAAEWDGTCASVELLYHYSLATDVACDCCGAVSLDDKPYEAVTHTAKPQHQASLVCGYSDDYDWWPDEDAGGLDERDNATGVVRGCAQTLLPLALA